MIGCHGQGTKGYEAPVQTICIKLAGQSASGNIVHRSVQNPGACRNTARVKIYATLILTIIAMNRKYPKKIKHRVGATTENISVGQKIIF